MATAPSPVPVSTMGVAGTCTMVISPVRRSYQAPPNSSPTLGTTNHHCNSRQVAAGPEPPLPRGVSLTSGNVAGKLAGQELDTAPGPGASE
ncbi:MAG: hypothetical protein QOE32_2513 [Pseudonocardiales bacterium]|nr:hypothetical protein [Pseudonocardiales bacterium]